MTPNVSGIIPVVHTPFTQQDTIDFEGVERLVTWALERGADGICTGMVSEVLRLTYSERLELGELLASLCRDKPCCLVLSVGAESTKQAVEYARHAEDVGADAVMAVPPIHCRASSAATQEYFARIAGAISHPVIVQDASSYVGQPLDLQVFRSLLDDFGPEKILFKPEAAPAGPNLSRLLGLTNQQARVFEGSGGVMLVDNFRRGIIGAIPGMEFLPLVIALWRALRDGNEQRVYQLYLPLCALVTLQMQAGLDGFLAIEKYVLHRKLGLFPNQIRRGPYAWELDTLTADEVDRLLQIAEQALDDA